MVCGLLLAVPFISRRLCAGNSGKERRCERDDNIWPVMKGRICHRGTVPERAGLDSCVPYEEHRDGHGHSESENLHVSEMNRIFLCHITNWSGNEGGDERKANYRINKYEGAQKLSATYRLMRGCYIHLPLQSTPT